MKDLLNKVKIHWQEELGKLSGNLTTNAFMPEDIANHLLEDDTFLECKLRFEEVRFDNVKESEELSSRLAIIRGLQSSQREGYFTVFRAVRFPTYKRLYSMLKEDGFTISNYEQERILRFYEDKEYKQKRKIIQQDKRFWIQPQERVVDGIPFFMLVNDALQIHRAFRAERDAVALVILHIPKELLLSQKMQFIANTAIDLDLHNRDRDVLIQEFVDDDQSFRPDYRALRVRGIDLHEMYTQDLPLSKEEAQKKGIIEEYYLLEIEQFSYSAEFEDLKKKSNFLKNNEWFMHGFFGDQNIFGRREACYLPTKCYKLSLEE